MNVTMRMRPERRFIRPTGSTLHIDFHILVERIPTKANPDRQALTLALVLDRSGSMQGEKIGTAKQAALSVLDRLDERDQVAVVVFDDSIDVLQSLATVTPAIKASVRKALSAIQARSSTALHEGWLTGCKAIAADTIPTQKKALARCFLLTDGIANVGITDPEQIATEAAGIREHAGIGTSTFGIGNDYNEALLGPMAVAGGGQFHHLRRASEIADTFVGELGDMLTVAASQVRLEFEVETGVSAELISAYWNNPQLQLRQSIGIGDLQSGEERHVVVRLVFPAQSRRDGQVVRARLSWVAEGQEQKSDWQEVWFSYAGEQVCNNEPVDPGVMHWVALNEADHARREALKLNQQGRLDEARATLLKATHYVASNAGDDKALQDEAEELKKLNQEMEKAPLASPKSKEAYYQAQNRSRAQKDYRKSDPS